MIEKTIEEVKKQINSRSLNEYQIKIYMTGMTILEHYNVIKEIKRINILPEGELRDNFNLTVNLAYCLQKIIPFKDTTSVKKNLEIGLNEMKEIDSNIFSKGYNYIKDIYGITPIDILLTEMEECGPNIADVNYLIDTTMREWPNVLCSAHHIKQWKKENKSYTILENNKDAGILLDVLLTERFGEDFEGKYVPIAALNEDIEIVTQIKNLKNKIYCVREDKIKILEIIQ